MGKKMKLIPSLFKNNKDTKDSWQWPLCKQPKTLSFRAGHDMFKTVNSIFLDPSDGVPTMEESWFTNSNSVSSSTESDESSKGQPLETIIQNVVRSERLFFEPGDTSSILVEAKGVGFPFKESVALAMESENPYVDFKKSMEDLVESHGVKDWECLEEMLGWYLKMNGKMNHGFIVGAFVDLLFGIASINCCDSTSFSSACTSLSSPSFPLSLVSKREIDKEDMMAVSD